MSGAWDEEMYQQHITLVQERNRQANELFEVKERITELLAHYTSKGKHSATTDISGVVSDLIWARDGGL